METTSARDDSGSLLLRAWRGFEPQRDVVSFVENTWKPDDPSATLISMYDHRDPQNPNLAADSLGRRARVIYSGAAFGGPSVTQSYGYNDRNELTSADYNGGATVWTYNYDPIGNRTSYGETGQQTVSYASNMLNQYTWTNKPTTPALTQTIDHDLDGDLTNFWAAGDMNCDGLVDFNDINAFALALQGRAAYEAQYPNCNWLNADIDGNGTVDFNDINPFNNLLTSGNGAAGLARVLTWDAENRLIAVDLPAGVTPTDGATRAQFAYDHAGRRIYAQLERYDGGTQSWVLVSQRRFLWAGWLLLVELDALRDNAWQRKFTWGLDIAGQSGQLNSLEGAGAIGGLLALEEYQATGGNLTFTYCYDTNGNLGQMLNPAQPTLVLAAQYRYDPYGDIVASAGAYAQTNPWRFSTKWTDEGLGLYYYGYRWYSPGLGRWISRDPLAERGDRHLYRFVRNRSNGVVDPFGLKSGVYDAPVTLTQDAYVIDWDWFSRDDVEQHVSFSITLDCSRGGQVLNRGSIGPQFVVNEWDWKDSTGPIINPLASSDQCNDGLQILWGARAVEGDVPSLTPLGSGLTVAGAGVGLKWGAGGLLAGATAGGLLAILVSVPVELLDVEADWAFAYDIRAYCVCTSNGRYKVSVAIDRVGRLASGKELESNDWGWDFYTKYVETP
ncbi:MAG: RHS repeat-associated core domain-containing protein [Planctomycetota bacterium]